MQNAFSRRNFLAVGSLAATGVLAGCADTGAITITNPTTSYSDADILNFALNLEYLETEYYLRAATGSGLSSADAGGSGAGTVTGPSSPVAGLTALQSEFLYEFAQSELSHVRYLRSALGSAAIVRPAIDLQNSIIALATLAGVPGAATFNPFASFNNFLIGVALFEDIGVTAYTGGAPYISSASILSAAAGIQAKEAYTGALARTLIAATTDGTLANANLMINAVGTLSASTGGAASVTPISTGVTSGVVAARGGTLIPGDANSKAYGRTFDQVLHVAYGKTGVGVAAGGFFPSGLNGTIKTTTK